MAYTKTPVNSTYQTKMISLFREEDHRYLSPNQDTDYLNCFFESKQNRLTGEKGAELVKRSGTVEYLTLPNSEVRGVFYWEDKGKLYIAIEDDILVYTASTGVLDTTLSAVFSTTSGDVGFTTFAYEDGVIKVIATDGTTLVTIDDSGVVTPCNDADLPTPHLPIPVYLDGYLFLVKEGTQDIYNSELNDPLDWVADGFITAEMFPDGLLRIAKLNNYLLAFGSDSVEYFWDAANASGSPLQRNDTPVKLVGYLGGFSQVGNMIYFVGQSNTGTPEVFVLEDFKMTSVSDDAVQRALQGYSGDFSDVFASIVTFLGHNFYMLTIGNLTYAMELETKLWTRQAFQDQTNFPIKYALVVKTSQGSTSIAYHNGNATLLKFAYNVGQDLGVNFLMRAVTDREMFETYNQKFVSRIAINGDRTPASSLIQLSWSDDDYATFQPPRNINMNHEIPCTYRGGRFRRRAYKIEYRDQYPLRLRHIEIDLNMGQN